MERFSTWKTITSYFLEHLCSGIVPATIWSHGDCTGSGACCEKCIGRVQHRYRNTAYKYTEARPARVKHLFSAKGFSKWRESGGKNTVRDAITWLAGRLSICILSAEEFITDRIPFRPQTAVVIVRDTVPGRSSRSHAPRRFPFVIYPPMGSPFQWTATCPPPFFKRRYFSLQKL